MVPSILYILQKIGKGELIVKKITDFIVEKRNFILILFIILAGISVFLSSKVRINYDMTEYLPSDSETRIGMDIMEKEFEADDSSSLNLMFKGLSEEQKKNIYEELTNLGEEYTVDYEENEKYNKEDYTLYVINIDEAEDSKTAKELNNTIKEKYEDYEYYTNGSIAYRNMDILPTWIIALAIFICLVILIIMCESYVEPFLFLACIGIAILLNNGTNIIFGSVSNITSSIAAILQLALSMDYSIMLINRYMQEKANNTNKVEAMKEALHKSFRAISSSSVTTIVGLLALVFMSFTIGRDLGFVLAKGVLLSLLTIFTCLPALILMCDKWIVKTKKKSPKFNLKGLGKLSYICRKFACIILLVIFVASYILKGNLKMSYTASENDEVSKIFPTYNQMAIIYNNKDEAKVAQILNDFENNENVDFALGYGNTINEKLTYDKFNDKLTELETDTQIEEYLLKIIYYKYYNDSTENRMTFNEFVNFIKTDVLTNEKFADKLNKDTKNQMDLLSNFTTVENINKKRTYKEIADILGISENDMYNLFVYYNSDKVQITLNINEFMNFINKDVLTNETYSSGIPKEVRENLNTLNKFLDKNTITKSMDSTEMSKMFGMDKNQVDQLYLYYYSIYGVDNKLSINEFANFIINNVLTNNEYANQFDEATIKNLKLLQTMSDKNIIDRNMNSTELSSLFGIDEKLVQQLLLLEHTTKDNGTTLTVVELIDFMNYLKENTKYLDGIDISNINKLRPFAENKNGINTIPMSKIQLNAIFNGVEKGLVDKVYSALELPDETQFSLKEFVDLIVEKLSGNIDTNSLNSFKLIKTVMDDSINPSKYTATQISIMLNIPKAQTYQIYGLYEYTKGNTSNWKQTPYQFVKFILDNSTNEQISANMNNQILAQLKNVYNIMQSTKNNSTYSYKELSETIGIDSELTKKIYVLNTATTKGFKLTPVKLVDFILEHKEDETLKASLNTSTINNLKLIDTVMDSVISNKKYSADEISKMFGLNIEDVKLLYSLYSAKYVNSNMTASLQEFVGFTLNKVIPNPKYSSNFDKEKTDKLNAINGIMNGTINNTKYLAPEIHGILSKLTNSIDKNTIEVLYIYYGSEKHFQNDWTLTVEELVQYVNNDILKDPKFNYFIDEEIKTEALDSKEMIEDSKKKLVGDNYSRILVNTKYYDLESDETYKFIQSIYDKLDGTESYIIGDSPMSYEMSKSFMQEFDFISLLTMIAIFIVVALTFKSFIIPLILVLIIQCAVYTIMGILGMFGGSVYFIALLIVQSILMGATIDYAIVYTSYYKESRETLERKESIINAYNKSIHTILTSSSILISATFLIGLFSKGMVSKICITLSQGVLCSTILIVFILPAILALFDKFIIKKKK